MENDEGKAMGGLERNAALPASRGVEKAMVVTPSGREYPPNPSVWRMAARGVSSGSSSFQTVTPTAAYKAAPDFVVVVCV